MNDPVRLGDPRSKRSAALRRLIQAGRSDLPNSKRVRTLAERLGFGPVAPPAVSGSTKPAAAGLESGTAAKVGVAAKLGAATKIGVVTVAVLGTSAGVLATSRGWKSQATVVAAPSPTEDTASSSMRRHRGPENAVSPSTDELSFSAEPPLPLASVAALAASGSPLVVPKATNGITPPAPTASATERTAGQEALGMAHDASSRALEDATPGTETVAPRSGEAVVDTEVSLLEEAQAASRGDPQRALDLTDRDALRFPNGTLAQEREVIAIDALTRLGRMEDARARARLFFQAFPGSAHGPRVAALVGHPGISPIHDPSP
jgi:hypothetical protein